MIAMVYLPSFVVELRSLMPHLICCAILNYSLKHLTLFVGKLERPSSGGGFIPPLKIITFSPLSSVILASSQLVSNDQAMTRSAPQPAARCD
jgi:hypothetical protein